MEHALVRDVTISGITIAHSMPTYLSSYEMPTGGDVSVHRGAAVVIGNTSNCTITDATFASVGGNGVLISGKNFNTRVAHSEFAWTGELHQQAYFLVGSDTQDN